MEIENHKNDGQKSIEDLQIIVDKFIQQNGGYWTPLAMLASVMEELGELSREINHLEKIKIKKKEEITGEKKTNAAAKKPAKADSDDFDEFSDEQTGLGFQFIFSGFIELENFFNTYIHQKPEDAVKKNEIRLKLSMQLGNDSYYFKLVPNIYVLPFFFSEGLYEDYRYAETDFMLARNGRMSGRYYEMSFNECFVNLGFKHFRIRLGNQLYAWGTADVFNPTSYINPADSRELFYKDADETKLGVPSLSSMIFISDFTIEFVFIPIHVGAISPVSENFWSYHYRLGFMTIVEDEYRALPPAGENLGYGLRFSGSASGVDFSVCFYHGPDVNPILRPMKYLEYDKNILVKQEYHTSTNLGWDISYKIWKFELHAEMSYSPNKYGVVDEVPKNFNMTSDNVKRVLEDPFRVRPAHWLSYALGFNFMYDDFLFTAEWLQSHHFDDRLMEPFYTHFLAMTASYAFLDDLITLSLVTVCDVKNVGYLLVPSINFYFESGVYLKVAYSHIGSKDTDEINLFTLFDKHDILILGVRYVF
jgi:hypothetical protein